MPANNFNQFVSKKAYEICYALFRIASSLKQRSFASHLEDQGLSLLKSAAEEDYKEALDIIADVARAALAQEPHEPR